MVLSRHSCLSIGARCISQRMLAFPFVHCFTTPVSSIITQGSTFMPEIVKKLRTLEDPEVHLLKTFTVKINKVKIYTVKSTSNWCGFRISKCTVVHISSIHVFIIPGDSSCFSSNQSSVACTSSDVPKFL